MTEFRAAPEVAKIAADLIKKHHTHLADQRIEFVFRDKATSSRGRTVCGKAKKMTGLNAFLSRDVTSNVDFDPGDEFFLIEIAEDAWAALGSKGRAALVDHELCHLAVEYDEATEEFKLSLRGHDVEEFAEVIERHGLYEDELVKFAESIKAQLNLFEAE